MVHWRTSSLAPLPPDTPETRRVLKYSTPGLYDDDSSTFDSPIPSRPSAAIPTTPFRTPKSVRKKKVPAYGDNRILGGQDSFCFFPISSRLLGFKRMTSFFFFFLTFCCILKELPTTSRRSSFFDSHTTHRWIGGDWECVFMNL